MHKLPQPVKLWYLSSFFRYERAQAGRYRQFWQVGAEAIGSRRPGRRRGVDPPAARAADRAGRARPAPAPLLPRHPGDPRAVSRAPAGPPPRARGRSSAARSAAGSSSTRCGPSTATTRARGRSWPPPRACSTSSTPTTPRTSPRSARSSTPPAWTTSSTRRSSAGSTTTRGRCSSSPPMRSARRARVGGGGRYDGLIEQLGGPSTPGTGWAAGIERMLLAAEDRPRPEPVVDLFVASPGERATTVFALAAEGRRAGLNVQQELGRALAEGPAQAGRPPRRPLRRHRRRRRASSRTCESGEQETVDDATAVVARVLRGRHPG